MSLKIWFEGQLVDQEKAVVSVYDHGLLYGDGVFEGIRAYGGKAFELDAHIRRLFDCAKAIRLTSAFSPEQIKSAIYETMKANGFSDCYFRPVISRGSGDLGIDPKKAPKSVTFIIADQIAMYPQDMYDKGIRVVTSSWTRNFINATSTRVKSLNYLNNIMAKQEASDHGAHDALVLNHLGHVSELSAANIFVVRDGVLSTPPFIDGALEGITRRVILELAAKHGVSAGEKSMSRFDVYTADELFATGTGVEVMPITMVDQRSIGTGQPGPITLKLSRAFHQLVRQA